MQVERRMLGALVTWCLISKNALETTIDQTHPFSNNFLMGVIMVSFPASSRGVLDEILAWGGVQDKTPPKKGKTTRDGQIVRK